MLNCPDLKIQTAIKTKMLKKMLLNSQMMYVLCLLFSKMPSIVCILTFMSIKSIMLIIVDLKHL